MDYITWASLIHKVKEFQSTNHGCFILEALLMRPQSENASLFNLINCYFQGS